MAMDAASREMILIVCQSGACEEVIDRLRGAGVTYFTLYHGALGVGETGRHEGTPVWPGQNSIILCCLPEDEVKGAVAAVREVHDSRPGHTLGVKIFAVPVRELL